MSAIKDDKLTLVKKLYYKDGLSMKMVGSELDVFIDAVVYFMRRHKLKRRTLKEDSVIRFKNKPLSYNLRKNLNTEQKVLKAIGVILYRGEGYKTEKSKGIDLANSDVSMVLVFMRFLREICGINEKRLRILLYCYSNQNPKNLIKFWSKVTKISENQFTKPYVRNDFKANKVGKMPKGMIHLRYADKKLLAVVMSWIGEYIKKYAPVA